MQKSTIVSTLRFSVRTFMWSGMCAKLSERPFPSVSSQPSVYLFAQSVFSNLPVRNVSFIKFL